MVSIRWECDHGVNDIHVSVGKVKLAGLDLSWLTSVMVRVLVRSLHREGERHRDGDEVEREAGVGQ